MDDKARPRDPDVLLDVVADLLGKQGYDRLQIREVARRAQVSTRTIYQRYDSREELIVAALERWLQRNRIARLAAVRTPTAGSIYDRLMPIYRTAFEPWQGHPRMLSSFHRAGRDAAGKSMMQQGDAAVRAACRRALADLDPALADELLGVLQNVVHGLMMRFSSGDITVNDILPGVEQALRHLAIAPGANRAKRTARNKLAQQG